MRTLILPFILLLFAINSYSQTDIIYMMNGDLIKANITEIDEANIKYCYPGEDFNNSISRSLVLKIQFKSGRTEEYSSTLNLTNVKSCMDWEEVQISNIPSEVVGMFKIDDISVKAQGAVRLGKLESRVYNKIKMQSAMLGGNTCYIIDKYTKAGTSGINPSAVSISAISYTSKKIFRTEINFGHYIVASVKDLKSNSYEISKSSSKIKSINITNDIIYSENNFIKIRSNFISKIEEYTIIFASKNEIILSGVYTSKKGKETYYNIFLEKD